MRSLINLAFLLSLSQASIEYSTGSGRTVLVTIEFYPGTASNMSNTKCIEFTAGAPPDYTEACVTSIFSGNDQLAGCKVSFDDTECNNCELCTDAVNNTLVGMRLNCNNRLPSKNIQSTCLVYSDAAIQEILDNGYFTEQFDFDAAAPEPEPEPTDNSGTASVPLTFGFVSMLLFVLIQS